MGSVVAPNLGDAQTGVDRELVERGAGNVHFDDQVWRWVHSQVYPGLAAYALLVPDVEAGVGLETSPEIAAPVSCRAYAIRVDAHLFGEHRDEQADEVSYALVLRRRAHDLQVSPVVGQPRYPVVSSLIEQPLIGFPTYVAKENPLFCPTLDRFHPTTFSARSRNEYSVTDRERGRISPAPRYRPRCRWCYALM